MNKTAIWSMCLRLFFNRSGRKGDEGIVGDYIAESRAELFSASAQLAAAFADNACVRCGYCCREMPCEYAGWDNEAHQCRYLVADDNAIRDTTFRCMIYHHIIEAEQGKKYPMFGGGCSRPLFNKERDELVLNRYQPRAAKG